MFLYTYVATYTYVLLIPAPVMVHVCMCKFKICLYFTVSAQEGPGIVIVHPAGQDIELLCTVMTSSSKERLAWTINHGTPHTVTGLRNYVVAGYSTNGNNLIVENIMMNDDRNNTEYRCVIITTQGTTAIQRQSDPTTLYVAGEYQYR